MAGLRICILSAEVAPFAKTGGLADMVAGLSRYLAREGHEVRVFMPLYRRVQQGVGPLEPVPALQDLRLQSLGRTFACSVSSAPLPGSAAAVHFVRCAELFDRDAIYSSDQDEHLRFMVLQRASIESCQRLGAAPQVFHCHDWHTALLPLYLKTAYAWDRLFAASRTLLSLHNLGYQGTFPLAVLGELELDGERHLLHRGDVEAGVVNFLRTGVLHADALTTVSETYAREIQTPELGMGLEEHLRARQGVLHGIVNGVDYGEWDPRTDAKIWHRYGPDDLEGKAVNKRALLEAYGLPAGAGPPLCGIVSRLTHQKGFELVAETLPVFLQRRQLRLFALGSGEPRYERFFQGLRDTYPDLVGFHRGHDEELAHRIEAAADLFLMPSRYEPCGLNQMYSLRYGTVPVVRRTGGLADTVQPFDQGSGRGTGFVFEAFSADALFDALRRALAVYADRAAWRRLVHNGMAQDWSWDRQGAKYAELYRRLAAGSSG